MDRARVKELLPILVAFSENKDIQFRLIQEDHVEPFEWLDLPHDGRMLVTFPCDDYEYREKPVAREFWIPADSRWIAQSAPDISSAQPEWLFVRVVE